MRPSATSSRAAALLAAALAPLAAAPLFGGTINTFSGVTSNMATASNWSLGATPLSATSAGSYTDLVFTGGNLALVTSGGTNTNIPAESYNVTNGSSYSLQIFSSATGSFRAGATGSAAGESLTTFTNAVSGVAQDLVYLSNGSDLEFIAANGGAGAAATFVLRQAGNFNLGAGSVLTINPAITGNFAVNINGSGTTIYKGANTTTGLTTINGGTLELGASDVIANTAGIAVAGGKFDIKTFNDTVGAVSLSAGSITGSGGTLTGSSYAVTGSGSITANLAGSGGLTITSSAGTLTLGGTNTYSGVTYANYSGGGTLIASGPGALSPNSQYRTASSGANAGVVQLDAAGAYQMSSLNLGSTFVTVAPASGVATLTFANGGFQTGSTAKIIEPAANTTVVLGSTVGGSFFDVVGSTAGADRNIGLRGAGDIVVNSIIRDNASGSAIAFKGGVDKQGVGTLTLNAANTYTLGTTVSAGRLLVNNTTGSGTGTGPVSVTGGTLGGSGIISGAVTIGPDAFVSPGNSPGTLTLGSGLALDGTYVWEINANSAATGFDSVALTGGDLVLGSASIFQITPLGGVDFTNAFWTTDQAWTVVSNTGSGTITGTFLGGLAGTVSNAYGAFSLAYGSGPGADVTLNWTASAIPEPSSFAALAGLATLGLAATRRRRA